MNGLLELPGLLVQVLRLWWKAPEHMAGAFWHGVAGNQREAEKHIHRAMEKK